MKHFFLIILVSCWFFQSCEKEVVHQCAQVEENIVVAPKGDFQNLKVGDEFRYQFFNINADGDQNTSDYEFTNDTLLVSVVGMDDGKYVIEEKITAGSGVLNGIDNKIIWRPDSTLVGNWSFRNDSLIVEQIMDDTSYGLTSRLFFGHNDPIWYVPDFNSLTMRSLSIALERDYTVETEICGWDVTYWHYWTDRMYLFIQNGIINQYQYDYIKVMSDKTETAGDGNSFLLFYTKDHGVLRSSELSSWSPVGWGWELIY